MKTKILAIALTLTSSSAFAAEVCTIQKKESHEVLHCTDDRIIPILRLLLLDDEFDASGHFDEKNKAIVIKELIRQEYTPSGCDVFIKP